MDDSDLRRYTEELAHAHMAWAKAAPLGSDEEIQQAVKELAEARRVLAQKKDRLDHLLGHPWRVGMPGSCDCNKEREDRQLIVDDGFALFVVDEAGSQKSGGP